MTVETPAMIEGQGTNHVLVAEPNHSEGPPFHLYVVYIIGDTRVSFSVSGRPSSHPNLRTLPLAASDERWKPLWRSIRYVWRGFGITEA